MNRTAFLRALLGVVGVFAIIFGLNHLEPVVMLLSSMAFHAGQQFRWEWALVFALIIPLVLILVGLLLLVRPPRRLLTQADSAGTGELEPLTAAAILRAASVFTGVLVLVLTLPALIDIAGMLLGPASYRTVYRETWPKWSRACIGTVLGVYLLCGAPHLVQWQLRQLRKDESDRPPRGGPES